MLAVEGHQDSWWPSTAFRTCLGIGRALNLLTSGGTAESQPLLVAMVDERGE